MRYYIADMHFYHENILDKMDKRGFETVEMMNEYMIRKWNAKVRENDEVVILGDFCWGKAKQVNELLERLNGQLYLIRGNHDYFVGDKTFNHDRFVWVRSYSEIYDNKRKVVLCHYPILCYNGQYRMDKEGKPKTYMLHGHVHDTHDQRLLEQFRAIMKNSVVKNEEGIERNIPCNIINCFCMYSDYEPLTLDEWIQNDAKRWKKMYAYHKEISFEK
ncbi:MAG: metallophosphoesterase family protein [Lachnospiraceae bacterium]|nr:metallophosphoesterase family protein [Lachnospiraceae bacterium]